jgi:hypothetical protein
MREARDMGGNILLPGRTGREVDTGMASNGDRTKEMFSTGVPTKDRH